MAELWVEDHPILCPVPYCRSALLRYTDSWMLRYSHQRLWAFDFLCLDCDATWTLTCYDSGKNQIDDYFARVGDQMKTSYRRLEEGIYPFFIPKE